jgi:hypothetical protein
MDQEREVIPFDRTDPLEAFLRLSEAVAEWKRKAGRLLRVRLQPDEVAELATAETAGVRCQHRFMNERGEATTWRDGRVSDQAGGIVLFVDGADERHHLQVRIEAANAVWRSLFEPQLMQITLRQPKAPPQ